LARSSYIYLLIDTASGEAVGAFTVKHEMQTAWDRHGKPAHCWRYRDNRPYAPVTEVEQK
jgi:hypothetical protein